MRSRNDMHADEFAHSPCGRSARVCGGFHCSHIAAHHGGDVAGADLFPTDQTHFRGLHHRVGCFDHRHQPARLDHSQGLTQPAVSLCHANSLLLASGPPSGRPRLYEMHYFKFDTTRSIRSISSPRVSEIVSDVPSVIGHIGSFDTASALSKP